LNKNQITQSLVKVLESYDLEEARKVLETLKNLDINEELLTIETIEEKEVLVKQFPDRVLNRYYPANSYCSESLGQIDPVHNTWNVIRIFKLGNGYRVRFLSYDKTLGCRKINGKLHYR